MNTTAPSPQAVDRCFQAVFRPLVNHAWLQHCQLFPGINPTDKIAREAWYRATLLDVLKVTDTTKDLTPEQRHAVLDRFAFLARGCQPAATTAAPRDPEPMIRVYGWTPHQVQRFCDLAVTAHKVDLQRRQGQLPPVQQWARAEFERVLKGPPSGHVGRNGCFPWSKTTDFDKIMEHFGVIAQDLYWMQRMSESSERRMKHQLMRFLKDLAWIEYRPFVSWEYVRAIYTQSELSPEIEDCPAATLQLVLGMLDSRIRRLCKKARLQPCLLPTRQACGETDKSMALAMEWERYHGREPKRWPNGKPVIADDGVCPCGCALSPMSDDGSQVCYGCGAQTAPLPF